MISVFLYFVLSLLWLVLSKLKVCLQGLQRVEDKHNDPEVLLCYLESEAQNLSKPERRQRQGSFGGVGVPQLHCFPHLRPTDMGPYRTQMLMEATSYAVKGKKCSCKCNQCNRFEVKITVSSGKCDIHILDMSTGLHFANLRMS